MFGHFVTACGCEQYKKIEFPALPMYKLPIRHEAATFPAEEACGWNVVRAQYGCRIFKLVDVNMSLALAEYVEVQ